MTKMQLYFTQRRKGRYAKTQRSSIWKIFASCVFKLRVLAWNL